MSANRSACTVARCADDSRRADILMLVHAAFAGLSPPSGALRETVEDVAVRFAAGPVLIAQAGDELIGSVYGAVKEDGLYLTRMAVRPDWQKRGVGRALLAAAEAEARSLALRRLTLRVRVNLPANRAYFKRAGFAVTGQGQDPGRPPYQAMERPVLSPA